MNTTVFFLGSHPALSAAELAAYAERHHLAVSWDLSRLPVALIGQGDFPPSVNMQAGLGGTTMIGTLRATLRALPSPPDVLRFLPEILEPREGKRLVGVSALPCPSPHTSGVSPLNSGSVRDELATRVRALAMGLKRAIGMKGTRVVFPPSQRSDFSTAQLLHNGLPQKGTAIVFLVAQDRVDLVTLESIQDIAAYAVRDRGRPAADPGRGMLPPKVAQVLLNYSLIAPGGTVYDPFCGVGTIPMEAALMGMAVSASDISPTQVERTRANLEWLRTRAPSTKPHPSREAQPFQKGRAKWDAPEARLFVHDMTKGAVPLTPGSIDGIVTEGWLGPPRTTAVLPREAEEIFTKAGRLLAQLLHATEAVVRVGGRAVIALPAFRSKKRVFHFPLERLRARGWVVEPLVPAAWTGHPLFRSGPHGTLVYGRPDAVVLREIARFRRKRS